ncbi:MAG: hypothetical protein RLN99_04665, partial [Kiloniellaceae bacterium]
MKHTSLIVRGLGLLCYISSAGIIVWLLALPILDVLLGQSVLPLSKSVGAIAIVLGSFFLPTCAFLIFYTVYLCNSTIEQRKPRVHVEILAAL